MKICFIVGIAIALIGGGILVANAQEFTFQPEEWIGYGDIHEYHLFLIYVETSPNEYDVYGLRLLSDISHVCEGDWCIDDRGVWIKSGHHKEYLWKAISILMEGSR